MKIFDKAIALEFKITHEGKRAYAPTPFGNYEIYLTPSGYSASHEHPGVYWGEVFQSMAEAQKDCQLSFDSIIKACTVK